MATIRPWAVWRRSLYGSAVLTTLTLIGLGYYFAYFHQPPTCFDERRNGGEGGVDCGGSCVRICAADVVSPRVMWVNSFQISEGQYNAVAYIENQNQLAGTPSLEYTIELLSGPTVVATRTGSTVLPPNSIQPIFVGRIFTDGATVTETRITLKPVALWQPATIERAQFRSLDIDLQSADSQPRLRARVENTSLQAARDVEVVATIFNNAGQPVTASQTFMDSIAARSTKDIVFTWPQSIAKTVRSCLVPTDVMMGIDLSGSMNNDGGDPPQPITDALAAAKNFAAELRDGDQIGMVTFATAASLVSPLTTNTTEVGQLIDSLFIAPIEETGFTNTVGAFILADEELRSTRHNDNARRVFVLLTDGLPTAVGDIDIISMTKDAASTMSESGVDVYAIGLGSGVDKAFIDTIASSPDKAFYAPTTDDLNRIYSSITSSLCESGATKIDIIATPVVTFTPLR